MSIHPKRGEVWRADLDPTRGDEIQKSRPVAILSDDSIGRLRLRIVVPITDWDERYAGYPWMVRGDSNAQNGLTKPSAIDAFQVRSVSLVRLVARIGVVFQYEVDAVALCVGFRPRRG